MKVRSTNEIMSLDDELNLFDEREWNFMSVVDNHDDNYEYFNDIRDTDFDKHSKARFNERLYVLSGMFVLMLMCLIVTLRVTVFTDKADYEALKQMQSIQQTTISNRIDGDKVDSDEVVKVSKTIDSYFKCVSAEGDYNNLYNYCIPTSTFADTYYGATSKIETIYDTNDCYARALRQFAGYIHLNKVSEVIYKDGIYYAYINATIPTVSDVNEYIHMYSYNFTKEFQDGHISEAEVLKYLLKNIEENRVPTSSVELCIKLNIKNDEFRISDDSAVTSTCVDAYTTAVNQLTTILGGNITTPH